VLRRVIDEAFVGRRLADVFSRARRAGQGLTADVYPLRQLHVLLTCVRI
jgi:hypothetical protein